MTLKKQTKGAFNLHPDDAVDNVTATLLSSDKSVNSRKIELATGF